MLMEQRLCTLLVPEPCYGAVCSAMGLCALLWGCALCYGAVCSAMGLCALLWGCVPCYGAVRPAMGLCALL